MKLVWLDVNASYAHRSLALPLIHLASAGVPAVTWRVVRALPQADPAALAAEIHEAQPEVVAATLYLFTRRAVLDVLMRVKVLLPHCTVVVGGPECLGDNGELLRRQPCLDLAVRGEGEAAMPELLWRLLQARPLAGIPGVCWRDAAGCPQDDGSRAVYAAWAEAPPTASSEHYDTSGPFAYLETSRGCPGHCAYCTSSSTPLRFRSLAAVREELLLCRRRGVREVRLLDRTFNATAERAASLLGLFRSEFPELRMHLEVEPGNLGEALRTLLSTAPTGSLRVEAGVQTMAPAALAAVSRHVDPGRALAGVRFLVACPGVTTHVDLLAGLPGQTLADIEQDVDTMLAAGPAEIQLETVKVLPGTPLRGLAQSLGLRYAPEPPYEMLRTATLDVGELRRAADWSRVLDGFYNAPPLQPALRAALRQTGAFAEFAENCRGSGLLSAPASLERRFRHAGSVLGERDAAVADLLRRGWLEAGLSPADPFAAAEAARTVPPSAEWLRGAPDSATSRTARLWRLRLRDASVWYVYDRARSSHAPIAWARARQ